MAYRITTVFMVYDGGDPHLSTALSRIVAWLEAHSQFAVDYIIQPTRANREYNDILNPYFVYWSAIQKAQFIFALNKTMTPSVGGGTWGVGAPDWGHFRDHSDVCGFTGISYANYPGNMWTPSLGFATGFEVIVMHEWKNQIQSWLVEPTQPDGGGGLGFSPYDVKNTYCPNDPYGCIDCTTFPPATERTDCYGAFLAQITPEMYAVLATDAPLIPISN